MNSDGQLINDCAEMANILDEEHCSVFSKPSQSTADTVIVEAL